MKTDQPETVSEPDRWEKARDGDDEAKRWALKLLQAEFDQLIEKLNLIDHAMHTLGVKDRFQINAARGCLHVARHELDLHTGDHIAASKRRLREAREAS